MNITDENTRIATLELNLSALHKNASYLVGETNGVIAVVKNNAYNFGLKEAVESFYAANIRAFATTNISEAIEIRKMFKGCDDEPMVLLLNPSTDFDTLRDYDISCSIANYDWLVEHKDEMKGIKWHLEWAGFMRRSGCRSKEEILNCLGFAKDHDINIEGIWTHFAWADEFDADKMYEKERDAWLSVQKKACEAYDFKYVHAQNSASFSRDKKLAGHSHVRVGILLYGCPGYKGWDDLDKIHHALDLYAYVITIKKIKQGESIGYCSSFKPDKDTKVAVINIGYGDGVLRKRVLGEEVLINNKRYKLVSMMMSHCVCVIDDDVEVGDRAVFYSKSIPVYEFTHKGVGANSEQISPLNHSSLKVKYIK